LADILSQTEIAELLNALSTTLDVPSWETEEVTARLYDFRTAGRFPKEQIREFSRIFEMFILLLSARLSGILRVPCECDMLSFEECSFGELGDALPENPAVLVVLQSPQMDGSLIMQLSAELSYMLISRMFGGDKAGGNDKQLTEIELALIKRVLRQIISVLDEAWDNELTTRIERIETNSRVAQITDSDEPVAVVRINVKMGEESGVLRICIPRTWGEYADDDAGDGRVGLRLTRIFNTAVPLTAFFDETLMTVADIANLRLGDVVKLDHAVNQPLTVKVKHIPKFRAEMGITGSKYVLKIVDIVRE